MFSLLSLSKSKCFTRVATVFFVSHSYGTDVARVARVALKKPTSTRGTTVT